MVEVEDEYLTKLWTNERINAKLWIKEKEAMVQGNVFTNGKNNWARQNRKYPNVMIAISGPLKGKIGKYVNTTTNGKFNIMLFGLENEAPGSIVAVAQKDAEWYGDFLERNCIYTDIFEQIKNNCFEVIKKDLTIMNTMIKTIEAKIHTMETIIKIAQRHTPLLSDDEK